VVAGRREEGEGLLEQRLRVLGQVGEVELLPCALELDEIRRELDAAAAVEFHREAQEDRRVAGRAAVDDTHLRRLVLLQGIEVGHRHR